MKERPILFNAEMVRAILDGRKTQTRRLVKQNLTQLGDGGRYAFDHKGINYRVNARHTTVSAWANLLQFCPYGLPSDRLWVKETICRVHPYDDYSVYAADGEPTLADAWPWKSKTLPAIHCPRGLSRIELEITGVRVERLQDISDEDVWSEGWSEIANIVDRNGGRCKYENFAAFWESINGPGSWDANPWVWVIEFKRLETGA